jgi:hypothetical protein
MAGRGIWDGYKLLILSSMMGVNPFIYHNREFALFCNRIDTQIKPSSGTIRKNEFIFNRI